MSLGVAALLFTVACNVVALVWGAAKLSGTVDRLSTLCDRFDTMLNKHEVRISVLETSIGIRPLNRRNSDPIERT